MEFISDIQLLTPNFSTVDLSLAVLDLTLHQLNWYQIVKIREKRMGRTCDLSLQHVQMQATAKEEIFHQIKKQKQWYLTCC